jgi:hypothetical protein
VEQNSIARTTEVPAVGAVETWVELADVSGPLVSFQASYRFGRDQTLLTSTSTLRFRRRDEVETALREHGFILRDVATRRTGLAESSCSWRSISPDQSTQPPVNPLSRKHHDHRAQP